MFENPPAPKLRVLQVQNATGSGPKLLNSSDKQSRAPVFNLLLITGCIAAFYPNLMLAMDSKK